MEATEKYGAEGIEMSYFWKKKTMLSYFLAIMVFWIHCSTFANYHDYPMPIDFIDVFLRKSISRVAVPLFFMISGALFFRNYSNDLYMRKIKSRVRSLIIPYLAWNTLNMLFNIIASLLFSQYFIGREKFEFTISNIINGIVHYEYNIPFWYMFALIVFSVSAPIIDIIISNKYVGICITLLFAGLCNFGIGLPVPFFLEQTCIIYYLIGALIGKYYFNKYTKIASKKHLLISAIGIIISCTYEVLINYKLINNYKIVTIAVLLVFSWSVWNLFDLVCVKMKIGEYMPHSFWVFAMHENVSAVITKLTCLLLPKHWSMAIPNFVLTTILTLVSIELACLIVKKMSRPLYNTLSGCRP